jgi:hypothetical protein
VRVAVEQEVVPHREQHVHVGLEGQPAQKLGEAPLYLGRVQREQLLELVHDQQRLAVTPAPAPDHPERHLGILEADQLAKGLGISRQL